MNRTSKLVAFMAMLGAAAAASAEISQFKMKPHALEKRFGPRIEIPCHTSCVMMGVTYPCIRITNPLQVAMPAGTSVHYQVPYSNPAEVTLQAPIPPNADFMGIPPPGNQGPCTAWLYAGLPDLQVVSASLVSGQLQLLVKNGAPFAAAPSSVARVRLAKCSQIELGSIDVPVPQVPPQATITVLKGVTLPAGFQYFDATADIAATVRESNENNNTFTGVGVCIH
ncbi:MAG: hypothetical protein AB1625_06745 [Acidobacteriota bacterium]